MILAIDFDGTICNPSDVAEGKKMGNPMPDAIEVINKLFRKGNRIIIFSNRAANPGHVKDWLKFFGIKFHEITNIKPNADVFIDDKAIRFTTWEDMVIEVGKL